MGDNISRRGMLTACGALLLLAGACGGDGDSGTDPGPQGDYSVVTVTSGEELDPDGYEIRVNDVFNGFIGANDSLEFFNRDADTYGVQLVGVAPNCTVDGENPRQLEVIANAKTATTFEISCISTVGVLQVVTATSGENPDDSYTLVLDELEPGTIGANDTVRTEALPTGEHTVRLGSIALNCRLAGDVERVVTVPVDAPVETTYDVFCTDRVGNLRLVTSTTGLFPDPDGYEVVVEFGDPVAVTSTGVRTLTSVAGGVTRVRLVETSVAENCSLLGENPRAVDVPSGGLIETVFEVACEVP